MKTLDHQAIRCHDKWKVANFYTNLLGYKVQQEFELPFKYPVGSLKIGETFLGPISLDWGGVPCDTIERSSYLKGPFKIFQKIEYNDTVIVHHKKTTKCIDPHKNVIELPDYYEVDQGSAYSLALIPPHKGLPEIFISQGEPNSIVHRWVEERGGKPSIHHQAIRCDTLEELEQTIKEWKEKGIEFSTDELIKCEDDGLWQIFTREISELGGLIIELICRGDKGFCSTSVQKLMKASQELK